jgi:hypothetical protein
MPDQAQIAAAPVYWFWQDGFDRHGYGDGDGPIMTDTVVEVLKRAGYAPTVYRDGMHNEYIYQMTGPDAVELVDLEKPYGAEPETYLPQAVRDLLDAAFPIHPRMKGLR